MIQYLNCIQAPLALYRVWAVSFRKVGIFTELWFVENRCFLPQKPSAFQNVGVRCCAAVSQPPGFVIGAL